MQEPAPELPEPVQDCFGSWFEPFAWFDRATSSWKTWQRSLIEAGGWESFSEPWPKRGMTLNGIAYRLTKLERHTVAQGSGSPLPTVTAQSGRTGAVRPFDGGSGARRKAAKLLPTVTTQTLEKGRQYPFRGGSGYEKAKRNLLPTPTVHGNYNRSGCSPTSGDGFITAMAELFGPVTGKPSLRRFVEWMFGLPQDWTALETPEQSDISETQIHRKSPS